MSNTTPEPGQSTPAAPGLKDFGGLHEGQNGSEIDLDSMEQADLLHLRAQIEARLKNLTLEDVNLVKETLIQLQLARQLQADANKKDSATPMNQRAQVQNSLSNIITTLAKVQMELYTSERIKRIQSVVVKVMKRQSEEVQKAFFDNLETELTLAEQQMESE